MQRLVGAACSVHSKPSAGRSMPSSSDSPRPSRTGEIARCISSTSPARRYSRIVATPPPRRTSRPAAASRAALECRRDAVGDEVERRAAFHLERRARVVGQHEDRHVVRRARAPPALPAVVGPRPAHRAEHVAAEDPGADAVEAARGVILVDAGRAAFAAVHPAERAGREGPFVQRHAADAERVLEALVGAGAVAVDRHREGGDSDSGHRKILRSWLALVLTIRRTSRPAIDIEPRARAAARGSLARDGADAVNHR